MTSVKRERLVIIKGILKIANQNWYLKIYNNRQTHFIREYLNIRICRAVNSNGIEPVLFFRP